MATEAFSICPPDSIIKDIHIEVEPHKNVTSDVTTQLPGATLGAIAQPPKRGEAEVNGNNLTYASTSDECRRDTVICKVAVGSDNKYVRYVVHVRAKTGGEGTDFWLAFMNNHDDYGYSGILYIDILSAQDANVVIQSPLQGISNNIHVAANTVYRYSANAIGACKVIDYIDNKGIHITSDVPISVVANNFGSHTSDATTILPTSALGCEYSSMSPNVIMRSEMCIVGTQNGTIVTIIPSVNVEGGHTAGVPYNIWLSQGEVYLMESGEKDISLGKTRVIANKPVAVFDGSVCTYFPIDFGACDHNYEQVLPYKYWGQSYVFLRLSTKRDFVRLFTLTDSTVIKKNGEDFITLNAGEEYEELMWGDVALFEANHPFAMTQHVTAFDINGNGDPAMLAARPLETGIEYALFNIPKGIEIQHFAGTKVNIVTSKSAADGIYLDGKPIVMDPVVDSDSLYYATITGLSFGVHSINSTNGKFIANCSAVDTFESYCFQIAPAVEAVRDTLEKINASICANQTYDFNGRCLDKPGVYYDTLYSVNWRDSIVELTLTVQSSYEFVIDTTMTYWSSLDWREHHLTNIIHDTLIIDSLQTIGTGCDSVYVLNLTAQCAKVDTIAKDTAICANDWPYRWHTYRDTLINGPGIHHDSIRGYKCDSVYFILNVITLSTDTTDTTIYVCPSKLPTTWSGEVIDHLGDYEFHHTNQYGCDSVVYLHALSSVTYGEETVVKCVYDLPYEWHGHSLTTEGTYMATLTNQANCDSIVTLHFYITTLCDPTKPINPTVDCIDTTYSTTDTTFCERELAANGFLWFESMYYEPGEYRDTLVGQNYLGCDSVGTLILHTEECGCDTAYSHTYTNIKEEDLPYTWNNQTLPTVPQNPRQDTILVAPLQKFDLSCDSIATLHLHVLFPCELPTETLPVTWKRKE